MLDIVIVQVILGCSLFLIVNWIGKHSYSVGYISLSIFVRIDEAPAFNFIIRILTPVIYLLIIASILYGLGLDRYTNGFYMVSLYYVFIRLAVNLLTDRWRLLNWGKQLFYWFSIMILSYYTYEKIIIAKTNLLPDFSNLANELWIIIIVFVYNIFNKIEISSERTIKRKENYLESKFTKFKREYGGIINSLNNRRLIALAYSILIYENFNRPYIIRILERILFSLNGKPRTLGIMQVRTDKYITDRKSVSLGVDILKNSYNYLIKNPKKIMTRKIIGLISI